MFKIGCHLSAAKGYTAMINEAIEIGANTFQFFTRNPRGGKAKKIDPNDIENFLKIFNENNFVPILAHAPYTLNACSADEKIRNFALNTMKDDIARLEYTKGSMYNFHPGNHLGQGVEVAIDYISGMLNSVIDATQSTTILIETMSGKGTEIGKSFEEIKKIIDKVKINDHVGVCLDTCHVYSAGYNIVDNLDDVLNEFDNILGLERLKAIHLNDSMTEFNSHKDRHEKIGNGTLGLEAISNIINHPYLKELPFYLETPLDSQGHAKEIVLLKKLYKFSAE